MGILLWICMGMAKAYMTDSDVLLRIKHSLNNPPPLDSWKLGTTPCVTWVGLVCTNGFVTNLHLRSMSLSGDLDLPALSQMPGLRIVSLENNSFSGPIPQFNTLPSLKALYLSFNRYSGEIPSDYFSAMPSLRKIWLDANNFTGAIPSSIARLPNLIELHLEDNWFSGTIPPIGIGQPSLEWVDLSHNNLSGQVPAGLQRFDAAAFQGNPGLCFLKACPRPRPSVRTEHILMGVSGSILVLMVVAICVLMRRNSNKRRDSTAEVSISRPEAIPGQNGFGAGQKALMMGEGGLMVLKEDFSLRLSEVMKAAAEVLGKATYKASMSNGMTVVVKRLKDSKLDKEGFEAEMRRLGKLSHPNVLPPIACLYRKDEKLLIYDYIPTASLLYLLHEKRHAINWDARLKIIKGMAQGMGYIHSAVGMHGNLKSSSVLVGSGWQALVADFGLHGMGASPERDVYCLGIIILEVVTGYARGGDVVAAIQEGREEQLLDPNMRSSSSSSASGEIRQVLHIGAACTETRIDMREAVRRIENIGGGYDDAGTDSSYVSCSQGQQIDIDIDR